VRSPPPRPPRETAWQQDLATLRIDASNRARGLEPDTEILYVLDVRTSLLGRGPCIDLMSRSRKRDGAWAKPRALSLALEAISGLADERDRELLPLFNAIGGRSAYSPFGSTVPNRVVLPGGSVASLLAKVFATGRTQVRPSAQGKSEPVPCTWDDGPAYTFQIAVVPSDDGTQLLVRGELRRGDAIRPLLDRVIVFADGIVVFRDHAARLALTPIGFR